MSGKPHAEGVAKVIGLLSITEALNAEAQALRPKVQRLQAVEAEMKENAKQLLALLQSMDVEQTGNFGWESRFGWFLAEMRRQIVASAPKPEPPRCGRGDFYDVCPVCR
jgi:hypothetical protein